MMPKRRTPSGHVLAAGLLTAGLAAAAPQASRTVGPTIIELRVGEDIVIADGAPPDLAALQAGPSSDAASSAANSARAKKLKKLLFDRRPSAILAAWASPPPEPPEPLAAPEETGEVAKPETPAPDAAADEATLDEQPAAEMDGAPESQPTEVEEADADVEADVDAEPTAEEKAAEAAAKKAAKEAEAAAKKARKEAEDAAERAQKEYEAKLLEHELALFQRNVTIGDWAAVRDYLGGLPEDEGKAGYTQLLVSLVKGPPKRPTPFAQYLEQNYYAPEDVIGLIAAAPYDLEPSEAKQLGAILKACVDAGNLIERCAERLQAALDEHTLGETGLFVARTLIEAGFPIEAGAFLPSAEEAIESDERSALNLLARHYLALNADDGKTGHLERAWRVTQAALADGAIEDEVKAEALERAVEIAPRIRAELGQAWLDESFTARPERGMEILATIGAGASRGLVDQAQQADLRLKSLELQSTAAAALLEAAPELADRWSSTLNLLATNWLKEAQHSYQFDSSTSRGPSMRRDVYGNFFYTSTRTTNNRNVPKPIAIAELLDIRPSDAWLERVSDSLRPKLDMVTAQLLLKVNEEGEAFPFIERLAVTHPERAKELVEEFLRVWAQNHDPNSESRRTSSYMFVYGFEQRANSIPLTRSKQERNLQELSQWIQRLQALPIDDVDESLIAHAFTAAHSTAEVYRVETIERVFGSLGSLEPKTLAELVQTMRTNLVSIWRDPAVQKDKNTRRRQKDIQAEVLRGYEVALAVADGGLADHPDDWALQLARASVLHDRNNYDQQIEATSEFAARREEAFAEFARAADLYRAGVEELDESEETTKVYETWFYASLGACDLGAIDHEKQPVEAQLVKIEEALRGLPGEAAERHLAMFANTLFTRMSSVNPAVKFRYVRSGLSIVGDHERAREAREVFEYYEDLITEIRLETRVDGDECVGHGEPFGLYVDLVHTREIEREAGGFSKYLINQNNQSFSYNYGRPTENYRDKFEEAAREALAEQFEVLSITFNHPDVHSRSLERYGWRATPYAYVLLQARGPEVDRIPSLRLDLDFLDTTGYAVLPIESPLVPIDCVDADAPTRPFEGLELVQTLDERQADQGLLVLEVKGTARGLVPDLDEVLDLAPEGFEVAGTDDQGVSVAEFDEEGGGVAVVSDRTWLVTLEAEEGLETLPTSFAFGSPRVEDAEMVYQRYVDADLESVEPVVSLEERYGRRSLAHLVPWALGGLLLLVASVAGYLLFRGTKDAGRRAAGPCMPERLSPFTVIGLLREIEANNGVSESERAELRRSIAELESVYFREQEQEPPDLERIAESWLRRVS